MSFQKETERMGIRFQKTKGQTNTHMAASLASVLKLVEKSKTLPCQFNAGRIASTIHREEDKAWSGSYQGLVDDLSGKVNMKPFNAAKEKFFGSGLMTKLQSRIAEVTPRRKRFLSEHDGEYNLDRRYDLQPFMATKRALSPCRVVDVVADFSIACSADQKEVDEYGAMIWALIQLIEASGVQTRVIWRNRTTNTGIGDINTCVEIELKKPGQYLAPHLLAATFKAQFYRRAGFACLIAACEFAESTAQYSLGTPIRSYSPIEFKNGQLILTPNAAHGYTQEIEREVLKAIGA